MKFTVSVLKTQAKERGIKGYSNMNKDTLLEELGYVKKIPRELRASIVTAVYCDDGITKDKLIHEMKEKYPTYDTEFIENEIEILIADGHDLEEINELIYTSKNYNEYQQNLGV